MSAESKFYAIQEAYYAVDDKGNYIEETKEWAFCDSVDINEFATPEEAGLAIIGVKGPRQPLDDYRIIECKVRA